MISAPANGSGVAPPARLGIAPSAPGDTTGSAHSSTTWLIRASDGSYAAPVVRVTSTNQLTSLPIPLDRLQVGQAYFWKCIRTDAVGHPSLGSAETSFHLVSPPR